MERQEVEAWIEGYVRAWQTNEPDDIGRLFTEDARYYTAPYRAPWEGREGIVAGWLDRKDEPGGWSFRYEVLGEAGGPPLVRGGGGLPGGAQKDRKPWG